MTLEEQKRNAKQLTELWAALMPNSEVPGEDQFLIWGGWYSFDVISTGINRAAAKKLQLRETEKPMTLDGVIRYASGVMRNVRNDHIAQGLHNTGRAA